jgi:hypothetical protein
MTVRDDLQWVVDALPEDVLATLPREVELGQTMSFAPVVDQLRGIRRIIEALGREPEDQLPSDISTIVRTTLGSIPQVCQRSGKTGHPW